jgi:hypothetical protein
MKVKGIIAQSSLALTAAKRSIGTISTPLLCANGRLQQQDSFFTSNNNVSALKMPVSPNSTTRIRSSPSMQYFRQYSTKQSTRNCWKCSADVPLASPTCQKCSNLQSLPNNVTYFDILNHGNVDFSLDLSDVRRRFLQFQQDVHPDGFATEGERQRLYADQWSSFINKGWQTLRENLGRAIYIVRRFSPLFAYIGWI